jgi:hypothetical protein
VNGRVQLARIASCEFRFSETIRAETWRVFYRDATETLSLESVIHVYKNKKQAYKDAPKRGQREAKPAKPQSKKARARVEAARFGQSF